MKSNIEKTVYTCFCTDVIHEGHLNIIRKSKELGRLTVGVLCDSEMIRYNRFPLIPIEEHIRMIEEAVGALGSLFKLFFQLIDFLLGSFFQIVQVFPDFALPPP